MVTILKIVEFIIEVFYKLILYYNWNILVDGTSVKIFSSTMIKNL